MSFLKHVALLLAVVLLVSLCGCVVVPEESASSSQVPSSSEQKMTESTEEVKDTAPKITSSDTKMSKFFDISLFDEENYSSVYLGEKFVIDAVYNDKKISLPAKISELTASGWHLAEGNDYNENSLVFANESVELSFENEKGAKFSALFYNSSNKSIRISECNIVKIHIDNGYAKNHSSFFKFNVCGITNTSAVTDIIYTLGTPSHFYKKSDESYYFDYFLMESDRRNKIRIYIDLADDCVTTIEFARYN